MEVTLRESDEKQLWFFINHADKEVTISDAPAGENLVTGQRCSGSLVLPRNGVAVIHK